MDEITVNRPTTSPSNLHRREACPRSGLLEAGKPDLETDYAPAGRLFHRYWGNPKLDRSFLTADQRDLLELSDRLLRDVLNRLAFETDHFIYVEQTIVTEKLTGTPDQVFIWPFRKAALVADLKSGWLAVERAELNLQLRGYAVLVADGYVDEPPATQIDDVYVAILQPRLWSPSDRITLAHYNRDDIAQARKQIYKIIDDSLKPDAQLHAGEDQCRYCRAKLVCPAFREALALPQIAYENVAQLSKAKREAVIADRLKQLSDEQLEQLRNACKLAGYVEEPANDEARSRIEAGGFTNYTLGKPWEARAITNVRKAIALLALAGVATREEILDICTIPFKQLEESYRERTGATTMEARDKVNRVLASVLEREPRKPKILKK